MGEVYRARDTKLKRQVAIKILPSSLEADSDRLARFQREAEILASLNHRTSPRSMGWKRLAGVRALVLELVEGPTLADRIAQGTIPLDEALPIAHQIAEALEARTSTGSPPRFEAGEHQGQTGRTSRSWTSGWPRRWTLSASADATKSPTITTPAMTRRRHDLGTAAYMSPEQARGKPSVGVATCGPSA